MSLGNREGGADEDAEPEDLPNLVRRSAVPHGGPYSSASCDGQDGRLFSCEKVPPAATGLLYVTMLCEVGRSCIWGSTE